MVAPEAKSIRSSDAIGARPFWARGGLPVLVLCSGLILIVLGLWSLQNQLREAEGAARYGARALVVDARDRILARLRDLEALAKRFPPASFEIRNAAIVLPNALPWYRSPPIPQEDLSARVRYKIDQSEEQEYKNASPERAEELLSEALAWEDLGKDETAALYCALLALRQRVGRDLPSAEERSRFRALAADIPASLRSLALILSASMGEEPPAFAASYLVGLEPSRADALLTRMEDLAPKQGQRDSAPFPDLRTAIAQAARQRSVLKRVDARLAWLRVRTGFSMDVLEGPGPSPSLLLYKPTRTGSGRGILVSSHDLLEELAVPTEQNPKPHRPDRAWHCEAVIGGSPGVDGVVLWSGVWLRPLGGGSPSVASAYWIGSAFLGVGVVFTVLLLVYIRTLRREREAVATRSRFLTAVSHELRTPLSSIRMYSDMLREGRVANDTKRAEYHDLLCSESARLSALVENALDLGRTERGERSYDLRPVRVGALVEDVVRLHAPIAESSGIRYDTGLRDEECLVLVDRDAMLQALLNLLENARKHAVESTCVELRGGLRDSFYRLTIRDSGPGIPESEREAIFVAFYRGNAAERPGRPGLGIGLHLAREIVRAQGGDLRYVEVPPGESGACFELCMRPCSETSDGDERCENGS